MRPALTATLFALVAGTAPAALALAPKPAGPVAVVVAPWAESGEAARIVAAGNGTITGASHDGAVAIARSADADFVARLYRAGALLVLDAGAVAACLRIEPDHVQPRMPP